MSSSKITRTNASRLPAPALFVGPPSRNTSTVSLQPPSTTTDLLPYQQSTFQRVLLSQDASKRLNPRAFQAHDAERSNVNAPSSRQQARQDVAVSAEARWAEMQNTLEEVELSAIRGPGMTIFGVEHLEALENLRNAQISLAKAWARSEAKETENFANDQETAEDREAASQLAPEHSDIPHSNGLVNDRGSSGGSEKSKSNGETEKDIELSRERRAVNDRYFEKVNRGVLEVVQKLEEVAKAMKCVEDESKELWRGGESVDVGSTTQISDIDSDPN